MKMGNIKRCSQYERNFLGMLQLHITLSFRVLLRFLSLLFFISAISLFPYDALVRSKKKKKIASLVKRYYYYYFQFFKTKKKTPLLYINTLVNRFPVSIDTIVPCHSRIKTRRKVCHFIRFFIF